jgi:transaldolase
MNIFIDSADIDEIKEGLTWGVVDGITTNPSLIKKAQEKHKVKDMTAYIKTLCKTVGKGKDVSLEVIGTDSKTMIKQGLHLYKTFNPIAKNVVIKIPVNPATNKEPNFDGIKAIKTLADKGIPINTTLIFTPEQAWLAAKAGAKYVSPFAGRIDDDIRKAANLKFEKTDYYPADGQEKNNVLLQDNGVISGIDLCEQIRILFDNYKYKTKILAASLRNSRQIREAALSGADVATIPFSALTTTLTHHKTSEGMSSFIADTVKEYKAVFK